MGVPGCKKAQVGLQLPANSASPTAVVDTGSRDRREGVCADITASPGFAWSASLPPSI